MADSTRASTTEDGVKLLTPSYVLSSHLQSLIATHEPNWKQTPERSRTVRRLLNGEMEAPIPKGFFEAGAAHFRVDSPAKYLRAYHQKNLIAKDFPRVKRWARGDAVPLKAEATKIEQIMQAVMEDRFPFRDSVDIIQNDSVALGIAMPFTAPYDRDYALYEPDGKTIKARYQRDGKGRTRAEYDAQRKKGDRPYKVSQKASAQIRDPEKRDYLARHIPLTNEVIPPTAFIPVFGPGFSLDAVVVRRSWTVTEIMRRQYVWDGMPKHLSPTGVGTDGSTDSGSGGGPMIEILELYATDYDPDGSCRPYVAFSVGGKKTQKRTEDGLVDAIIDLRKDYGMSRLPCVLKWGPHWATPNPDQRGMPFPLPFAQADLAIDAILTAGICAGFWAGFPTLIEEPGNGPPDYDVSDDAPDAGKDTLEPMTIYRSRGPVKRLELQTMDATLLRIVEYLQGENREQGPPPAAAGGGGMSGFQASLARAYSEDAESDTRQGVLELFSEMASINFELLTGISKVAMRGAPIPIQRITPVPIGKRSQAGTKKREILDLTSDLASDLFDLTAEYPPVPNLAKGQQWAEWTQLPRPLVLDEEFREQIIGDEQPEVFEARRLRQQILHSPAGLAAVVALMKQLAGQADDDQQQQAVGDGQAVPGTDGEAVPGSNAYGLPLPQGPPGMPPGMPPGVAPGGLTGSGGLPNPGAQSLAGALGGTRGAAQRAAAAGGVVPPDVQLG